MTTTHWNAHDTLDTDLDDLAAESVRLIKRAIETGPRSVAKDRTQWGPLAFAVACYVAFLASFAAFAPALNELIEHGRPPPTQRLAGQAVSQPEPDAPCEVPETPPVRMCRIE